MNAIDFGSTSSITQIENLIDARDRRRENNERAQENLINEKIPEPDRSSLLSIDRIRESNLTAQESLINEVIPEPDHTSLLAIELGNNIDITV